MDLKNLFLIAVVLVTIVVALTEVLKKTLNIPTRFVPFLSVITGVLIALAFATYSGNSYYVMTLAGLIAGLAASGSFDLAKAIGKKDGEV